jgi:steroid delta-isomerase-like uncharacterized protein
MDQNLAVDVSVFIRDYFKAWTDGNIEEIMSYYSDDVVINLLGVPALLEGKKAVTDNFVVPFTNGFPGNHHIMQNYIHHENQVVIEWMFTAIHKGEFLGVPASGREINLPGCSVYTLGNGKITRGELYFNGPTLFKQMGVGG